MDHHVKKAIKAGPPGHDKLPGGGAVYDATMAMPDYKATATKPHREVPFLRDVSVSKALLFMKNKGVHPVKVRAEDMTTGHEWDNFKECSTYFHVAYCDAQGLTRTSDMAQQLEQYFYHGSFLWRTKDSKKAEHVKSKSFMFFLHKKLVGGRSRFTSKVILL